MARTPLMAERVANPPGSPSGLFSQAFVFVCVTTFLGYAQYSLLTPVLPLFIKDHGGSASLVGLVTAAFSVTSFALRPFIGRAVDTWSARGVMGLGTLAMGLASFGYLFYDTVLLLLVRSIHGTGWAAFNTGGKVLLSTSAPAERRGEASGYYSMAQGVATALVPAIALWVLGLVDYAGVFALSAVGGLIATLTSLAVPAQPHPQSDGPRESFWAGLVERSALLPSVLEFLTKLSQPAAAVFVPLYATSRGLPVESLVYYYLGYGLVGIAARGVLGSLSDRIGRGRTIAMGTTLGAVSLLLMALAHDIYLLTLGGMIFGLGTAAFAPSVMALAIDLAPARRRGAAMATYSMAFQLAQGAGGLLCGVLIDLAGFEVMYLTMAVASLSALLVVFQYRSTLSPEH
ncbi:MAG: MFS transporter [Chloroflexi bacterium]|nr:MFS transporter [Chloroflexota bacterium]